MQKNLKNNKLWRENWFWVVFVGVLVLSGCEIAPQSRPLSLERRLEMRLDEAVAAQAKATALWERLLVGEVVSCAETLDSPPLFELSMAEIQQAPSSAELQDYLNAGLIALHEAVVLWERECAIGSRPVSLAVVQDAEGYLSRSQAALNEALALWAVWEA